MMSPEANDCYCIVCRDIPLQRNTWQEIKGILSGQLTCALKGELLVLEDDAKGEVVHGRVALDHTKKIECRMDDVAFVTSIEYRILAPIKSPGERWDLFKEKQKMERIKDLRVDETVWVAIPIMELDGKSGLIGSSCLRGTIRYIGQIYQHTGTYFGIELQEPGGTCDGAFKKCRYFMCKDKHGIFLPASHLALGYFKQASSKAPCRELLLPLAKSITGQEFWKDDRVLMFDKDGNRISGKVKWTLRVPNWQGYVIGIETNSPDTSYHKFPEHVPRLHHLFNNPDHKCHCYLALPETVVFKLKDEPEGVSVDSPTQSYSEWKELNPANEHYRRKSDEDILQGCDVTNISQDTFKREKSEGRSPHLHRNRHPVHPFSVGSLVEVPLAEKNLCGTFRWTGTFPGVKEPVAGVELNEWHPDCGDGTWQGVEYFRCKSGHGMFVVMNKLKPYPRQHHLPRDAKLSSIPGNNSADSEVKDLVQALRHECKDLLHQHKQLQEDQQNLKLGQEELEIENQQIKEDYQQLIAEHRQLQKANDGIQATLDQTTTRLEQTTETLQTAMQKITQLEKTVLDMQPSWSIDPTELQMTDERIGGGGWGVVKAGLYHGTKVAVKEIYDIIVSDYNRATFQREMRIASLVRHPNLLLFLGAVTTGNLQIVTELMETTLRKVMENGRLTPDGISPIAKHVACALNYLHSRPDPIIHRDVSSANVLLSSRQKGWVAKLGDFGSANFLNRTNTKIPGAQLYSAPEAIDPSVGLQGPKMDTYSFGVLLLEMCVCRLPEPAVLRGAANNVPQWPQPKRLIGELALRCIVQDLDQRPYMAAVVNQL